jgi:hypothetical protein
VSHPSVSRLRFSLMPASSSAQAVITRSVANAGSPTRRRCCARWGAGEGSAVASVPHLLALRVVRRIEGLALNRPACRACPEPEGCLEGSPEGRGARRIEGLALPAVCSSACRSTPRSRQNERAQALRTARQSTADGHNSRCGHTHPHGRDSSVSVGNDHYRKTWDL